MIIHNCYDKQDCLSILMQKMEEYFPFAETLMWSMFNPRHFPIPEDADQRHTLAVEGIGLQLYPYDYAEDAVKHISQQLGWMTEGRRKELYTEWAHLIHNIVIKPEFINWRSKSPSEFWLDIYNDDSLPWTTNTQRFIQCLLVIPSGSSEIER